MLNITYFILFQYLIINPRRRYYIMVSTWPIYEKNIRKSWDNKHTILDLRIPQLRYPFWSLIKILTAFTHPWIYLLHKSFTSYIIFWCSTCIRHCLDYSYSSFVVHQRNMIFFNQIRQKSSPLLFLQLIFLFQNQTWENTLNLFFAPILKNTGHNFLIPTKWNPLRKTLIYGKIILPPPAKPTLLSNAYGSVIPYWLINTFFLLN